MRRDRKDLFQIAQPRETKLTGRWWLMHRANNNIRSPLSQGIPGTTEYAIDKLQARHAMMLIKSFNQWRKQRKRKRVVHANHQLVFPAFMQFDRLLFQFSHGMQNFPPLL
ncbi:Uncharacterised protein [Shigella sonnei]|nr:Uncharacterised protein [Shigella sonnei]